ncbi:MULTISPECIES: efflux RND transporter periplasmic adaptor subunit [unclassified Lysobacter]|uniref:efflux RND transporter periplasmic adaptor subunit n=1 Tax=unclassified Lysobacter TaxID=2635362 RepID=UPI001BEAFA61|nr:MULTISPECIES: efflux RND transporter periplasmic adaptor subunit [unclassified Lysobacter]MBT2748742.1 efflux RND transporter periplasmic adaptor subunit [Lysobacter sp. ISL-42]MBT2751677.1 efflux RND transporter periplasmic adaptor subunit [Lysobacter sp. ISL-50]MBT2775871.1 efflux RND transporter periplasmic adaptor subunit [Lysobacter sp. ISL-54]MBT2782165.1 efflux RND transporter periplasmic adaptor subunit [Lysobacter sp. ISL-52]
MLAAIVSFLKKEGVKAEPRAVLPTPVMSVALTRARMEELPVRVAANGSVAAWREAIVGSESDGLRLTEVRADVGDTVRRGDVLAVLDAEVVKAELAEASAAVAQVEAEAMEASANASRAKALEGSGAMSAQQIAQYFAAAQTARARLEAARAAQRRHRVRVAQARVLAPDDGVVSSRTATVGAVAPVGEELFRVIKDGRLEWRAVVPAMDLDKLRRGQTASLAIAGQAPVRGELRALAPTISAETRSGLAYVDLPRDAAIRSGAFASGYIEVGRRRALTLPQSAVSLREGFSYVMQVGADAKVSKKKVVVGRRAGARIEIIAGLLQTDDVIASGLGFLSDGDRVDVVVRSGGDDLGDGALAVAAGRAFAAPAWSGP